MATVFLVFVFISLGKWQLRQADHKTEIIALYEKNKRQPALPLHEVLNLDAKKNNRRVSLRGTPWPERQFLLDNKVFAGRVGFDVLTPFILENGSGVVLVDRGWQALGERRSDLPEVPIAPKMMSLQGRLMASEKGFALGGMDEGEQTWPRIIQYIDYEELSRLLAKPLVPFVVRLDADQPGAYIERPRPVVSLMPDKHKAYAFQWFALAVAVFILFLALNVKRKPNNHHA